MTYFPTLTLEANVTGSSYSAESAGMIACNCTSNAITVTLPNAIPEQGFRYVIKKTDATGNAVTINTTSSQTIDGVLTQTLSSQYNEIEVFSDGSNWQIINEYPSSGAAGVSLGLVYAFSIGNIPF